MGVVRFVWVMCACCWGVVGANENLVRKILERIKACKKKGRLEGRAEDGERDLEPR